MLFDGTGNAFFYSAGQTQTRPFEVMKDPAIPTAEADLVASTQAQARIRDDMNSTADMVNRIEISRLSPDRCADDGAADDRDGPVEGESRLRPPHARGPAVFNRAMSGKIPPLTDRPARTTT